jgi:enoyl-CoA hydratase/carnithine racemase
MSKLVETRLEGEIAVLRLNRPEKRNAINDDVILAVRDFFANPPPAAKVAVIHGAGEHFSAGLDLGEIRERDTVEALHNSRLWHQAFDLLQYGRLPVVAAMHGGVIGGGLELASACHVRVAEQNCFYALPEGTRGIFVGGGASVRVSRIIGVGRMAEMMLTGRTYNAQEGQGLGLSHHLVNDSEGFAKAKELAGRIAKNAPLTNYAILNALPRIADMSMNDGLFTESLMAAMTVGTEDARERLRDFIVKRAAKVTPNR